MERKRERERVAWGGGRRGTPIIPCDNLPSSLVIIIAVQGGREPENTEINNCSRS